MPHTWAAGRDAAGALFAGTERRGRPYGPGCREAAHGGGRCGRRVGAWRPGREVSADGGAERSGRGGCGRGKLRRPAARRRRERGKSLPGRGRIDAEVV